MFPLHVSKTNYFHVGAVSSDQLYVFRNLDHLALYKFKFV